MTKNHKVATAQADNVSAIGDDLRVSFEFFPPVSEQGQQELWHCVQRLAPAHPRMVSVTYGAGGSTRDRTRETIRRILTETDLTVAGHLTCVDASKQEVAEVVREFQAAGVRHIVALRGDPPGGHGPFQPHPDGYNNALELVAGLRRLGDFDITVATYPEGHPNSVSPRADIEYLKQKLDAGASRAITQFFFEVDTYLRFVERARAAGITAPIIPGILPITNFAKTKAFADRCGTHIPPWIGKLFDGLDDDPKTRQLVAVSIAVDQCEELMDHGVRSFHFFTLNRAELTRAICHILRFRPPRQPRNPCGISELEMAS